MAAEPIQTFKRQVGAKHTKAHQCPEHLAKLQQRPKCLTVYITLQQRIAWLLQCLQTHVGKRDDRWSGGTGMSLSLQVLQCAAW